MADGKAVHELAGLGSELEEDGREGAVERDAEGEGAGGAGVAAGGLEPAAQPELPGGLPASAAVAAGCTEGDHGGGAQAGPDRVPPGALRPGVCQGDGGGVRGAGARAPGEAVTPSGEGVGLRADEARAGGSAGGGGGGAGGGAAAGTRRAEADA